MSSYYKFITNKYTSWYFNIINKAKTQNRQKLKKEDNNYVYYEIHHIIPKSLGGTNEKNNLVLLTAKEHFVCHLLLIKMVSNVSHIIKMNKALSRMIFDKRNGRDYAANRIYLILNNKIGHFTPETREKIKHSKKGFTLYKDNNNKSYYLHKNDPLIQTLNLHGHTKNISTKGVNKNMVTAYNIVTHEVIKVSKEEFYQNKNLKGVASKNTGKVPNKYKGMKIEDYMDSSSLEAYRNKLSNASKERVFINNGIVCKRVFLNELQTFIDQGWVKGRFPFKWKKSQFKDN